MDKKYLIDANCFIQSKNTLYKFQFCKYFWEVMLDGNAKGMLYTTETVKTELLKGNDDDQLKKWAKEYLPENFIVSDTTSEINKCYKNLIVWASQQPCYSEKALITFSGSAADARLLATAKTHGYTIVTFEVPGKKKKDNIKIPDVADEFSIPWINLHELLTRICCEEFVIKK